MQYKLVRLVHVVGVRGKLTGKKSTAAVERLKFGGRSRKVCETVEVEHINRQ
jgi:hypothetical protein